MSFSSMYIAATGMIALGTGMQTISNNLANIETNGFKTMRTNYSDLISKTFYSSAPWPRQVGRGAQVQSIQSMFTQGAFRKTESPLDLALAGDGFFAVRSRISYHLPDSDQIMYTRAGAFTMDRSGYLEDPSGNILQGWAMSLPRPGETPVRLGSPVDVQITVMTIPPQATGMVRQVVNLSADAQPAYEYPAYELAERYAREQAEAAGQAVRGPAERAVWDPEVDKPVEWVQDPVTSAWVFSASNKYEFNQSFLNHYKEMFNPPASALNFGDPASNIVSGLSIVTPPPEPNRSSGQMTLTEFDLLAALAQADINKLAVMAGQTAYATAYQARYEEVYQQHSAGVPPASQWLWEGNGFAGAWDGSQKPPIDPSSYNHAEHQTVYDASGRTHALTTYYQKNPHEQNVWDYFVVCEPDMDDRLDAAGRPVAGTSLAGLLQKGKITFDANGNIKDLEAQDLNPGASRAAYVAPPVAGPGAGALADITIGGYYTGPGQINPAAGALVSAPRPYAITNGWWNPATERWQSANTTMNPPAYGFTWNDGLNSGFVAVETKYILPGHDTPPELIWVSTGPSTGYVAIVKEDGTYEPISESDYTAVITYPGPYILGNDGLTLSFNLDPEKPLPSFGEPGQLAVQVTAHSEQPGWAADTPNAAGYFDVDVKFKNAPPQTIALDMGARRVGGVWLLDEASTTQYGGKFVTVSSRQDGYPRGDFSHLYVTEDGIVTGVYSNKIELALYQLSITRFLNPWGLEKKGNNLFAVTRHSGPGVTSAPREGGAAMVLGGFLEQSNVDTATEIVNMIMTQRGFQANSKVVTTHDTMLATAIELKR